MRTRTIAGSVLLLVGCSAVDPPARVSTSTCSVELAVEEDERPAVHVDLGPGSCEKARATLIQLDKDRPVTDGYLVVVSVNRSSDAPIVSASVSLANSQGVESLLSAVPPPLPAEGVEPRPMAQHPVVLGAWSEIATGSGPNAKPYRVLVRIARS